MVDKVRVLGLEDTGSGGGQDLPLPTTLKTSEDYAALKGVAFENSDGTTIHGDTGVMKFKDSEETSDSTLRDLKKNKVSQDDTTPGYLESKIVSGTGITLTVLNPGVNETLEVKTSGGGGGGLETKAGTVAGASFTTVSGERIYDVVFSSAYADTSYAVNVDSTASRIFAYSTKSTTGFRIVSRSNNSLSGETVDWMTIKNGET